MYYDYLRNEGEEAAKDAVETLKNDGLEVRTDMDEPFWKNIGGYKAGNRVSLADCFAIALANREDAKVSTSDHHEFDSIAAAALCEVEFIR